MDQRDLVERAGRGDHDAFAALVGATIARLEAVARLILRDPELARDVVQEAYFRAWRDLPGLRDPDKFDAWLHRLTVNSSLDALRRRRRRPIEVELTPATPQSMRDPTGLVVDRDDLEAGFRHLTPELVRQELDKLPPDVPVWIFHIKPQFQQEITEELSRIDGGRLLLVEQDKTYEL